MKSLRKNVEKIAKGVNSHAQQMKKVRKMSQSLDLNQIKIAESKGETDKRQMENVGFEIASVMAEKIVRKRLELENKSLKK